MASILRFPSDFVDPGVLVETGQVRKDILTFPVAPSALALTPFEKSVAAGTV